jgi:hypothetical protein
MVVERIKDGCKELVELFDKAISTIEETKQAEKDAAIAEIEQKYAERLDTYKADREHYVDKIEIEEFVEEPVEEAPETVEADQVAEQEADQEAEQTEQQTEFGVCC